MISICAGRPARQSARIGGRNAQRQIEPLRAHRGLDVGGCRHHLQALLLERTDQVGRVLGAHHRHRQWPGRLLSSRPMVSRSRITNSTGPSSGPRAAR